MIHLVRKPCPNPNGLKTNYKVAENKVALKESSFDKCMYCESEFDSTDYGDVEHIKPKAKFPNLKFEWDNLGYACVKCNRDEKGDDYDPNFIDPFVNDPSEHLIALGAILMPKNASKSGQITIDIVGLNRISLVMKRSKRLLDLGALISRCNELPEGAQKNALRRQIAAEASEDKEYSFFKKQFIESSQI